MNKDAVVATIIGFGIGLVITSAFILGPNLVKSLPKISLPTISFPKKNLPPMPTPTPTVSTLTIDAPIADTIESSTSILVSGTSAKDATVVVEGLVDEVVVTVNGEGKYAGKVTLVEGKNEINVTSYANGKTQKQSVIVFYTPEKF